jgi:hypothetical protein
MEVYTIREVADLLTRETGQTVTYNKIWHLLDKYQFCQQPGESIKTAEGRLQLITDKGIQTLRDYLTALQRLEERRPKTYAEQVQERQKKAAEELSKKVMEVPIQKELKAIRQRMENTEQIINTKERSKELLSLKKREKELIAKLK